MGWIIKLLGGTFLSSITDSIKTIFGSRLERDQQAFTEDTAAAQEMADEARYARPNSNWFDSLIDGICRLPRPVGFFLTVWLFIWPVWDFESFTNAMASYGAFPQWIGSLIITVWGLWFGGRWLSKDMNFSGPSVKVIQDVLTNQKQIHQAVLAQAVPTAPKGPQFAPQENIGVGQETIEPLSSVQTIAPQEFQRQMNDTTRPLSLDAIVEWNKRNSQNHK